MPELNYSEEINTEATEEVISRCRGLIRGVKIRLVEKLVVSEGELS